MAFSTVFLLLTKFLGPYLVVLFINTLDFILLLFCMVSVICWGLMTLLLKNKTIRKEKNTKTSKGNSTFRLLKEVNIRKAIVICGLDVLSK